MTVFKEELPGNTDNILNIVECVGRNRQIEIETADSNVKL